MKCGKGIGWSKRREIWKKGEKEIEKREKMCKVREMENKNRCGKGITWGKGERLEKVEKHGLVIFSPGHAVIKQDSVLDLEILRNISGL